MLLPDRFSRKQQRLWDADTSPPALRLPFDAPGKTRLQLPDCAAAPDHPVGGDVRSVADAEEWQSNQISEECKSFKLGSKSQRFDPAGHPGSL
jgi:hypothetical protein